MTEVEEAIKHEYQISVVCADSGGQKLVVMGVARKFRNPTDVDVASKSLVLPVDEFSKSDHVKNRGSAKVVFT